MNKYILITVSDLTDTAEKKIYINAKQITAFYKNERGGTNIYLQDGLVYTTKEPIEDVVTALELFEISQRIN